MHLIAGRLLTGIKHAAGGHLAAGHPGFIVRMLGGFIFLLGMFLMAYNTWRTVSAAKPAEYEAAAQIA